MLEWLNLTEQELAALLALIAITFLITQAIAILFPRLRFRYLPAVVALGVTLVFVSVALLHQPIQILVIQILLIWAIVFMGALGLTKVLADRLPYLVTNGEMKK